MIRIGTGFDAHPLVPGRPLVLGGVEIPHASGLEGHSDGDALMHAVIDALLGAAALGDIGTHFPPGDPRYAGADSGDLLRRIADLLREQGWNTVNVDCTIVAERPRMAPHIPAMRNNLAAALAVPAERISVKATTTDGLGFTGRGEGIAALATVLIEEISGKSV